MIVSSSKPKRPGRPRKSEQASMETRIKILGTASRLFMRDGYEQVSLTLIAEACEVTKASVYYYFNNKAELYTEAMTQSLLFANRRVQSLTEQDKPVIDILRDIAVGHLNHVTTDPQAFIGEAEAHLTSEQIEKIRDAENAIHITMMNYFESLQESALLPKRDPYLLAHFYTGALMMGHRATVRSRFDSVETLADAIIEMFWHGVSG